jgi:hypothetical protein
MSEATKGDWPFVATAVQSVANQEVWTMLDLSTGPKKTVLASIVGVSIVATVVIVDLIFAVPFRRSIGFDIAFLLSAICVAAMAYETWFDFEPRRKQIRRRTQRQEDNSDDHIELPTPKPSGPQPNRHRFETFDLKPGPLRDAGRAVSSHGADLRKSFSKPA